jgi:DNA-binding NtrC family response regulator
MLNRLLGESAQIRNVRDMVEALSLITADVTVLIQGESGTGKALLARIIHETGPRSGGPFISVDRTVADLNVLELQLFGQERSAFTGAHQLRIGKFEAANQGTIFLGEIGDLHPALQGKLLHVLEDGQFSRVGGRSTIKVDVRVITATNQDLEQAVRAGRLREDLYYRLNTVRIVLPPLRERSGDVVILAEHFLAEACERSHRPVKWLTADAQAALVRHYWPGNVRELQNMMRRAVVLIEESVITADLLGLEEPPR